MLVQTCAPERNCKENWNIITFEQGIYGFEDVTQFVFVQNPQPDNPFHRLHAVGRDFGFVVIDPRYVIPDYDFELSNENMLKLGAINSSQFVVLSIIVLNDKIEDITANLKSPIIINTDNNRGIQLILDEENYHVKHRIMHNEGRSVVHAGDNQENW